MRTFSMTNDSVGDFLSSSSSAVLNANDNEEEEDYMSNTFVASTSDLRPGIAVGYSQRRNLKIEADKYENIRRLRSVPKRADMEREMREEGLARPVSEDSKGFALLAKMGFKPGMSIGRKHEGADEGIKVPIPLDIKNDRTGLGLASENEEKQRERVERYIKASKARTAAQERLLSDFQQRARSNRLQKQIISDIMKSRKACEELDVREGKELPISPYFWPIHCELKDDAPAEKRRRILDRLQCSDENDGVFKYSNGHDAPIEIKLDELSESALCDRLEQITQFLRSHHKFCIWCGCQFDLEAELEDQCPGETRADHDGAEEM